MAAETKTITLAEVAQHKDSKSGIWIVVHGKVYDVSKFLEEVSISTKCEMALAAWDIIWI